MLAFAVNIWYRRGGKKSDYHKEGKQGGIYGSGITESDEKISKPRQEEP